MRTAEQNKRAQVAYDTAYFVLPQYAHSHMDRLKGEFERSPDMAAMFYFVLAAKMRGEEPHAEDIRQVRGHAGRFDSEREYMAVEYLRFPAVDLLSDVGKWQDGIGSYVLAPYFSVIVDDREASEPRCFVLGQSPDALTTFRLVSPMMNANLGRGCEPELEAFLSLIRRRLSLR
jgi:hypothetical protein